MRRRAFAILAALSLVMFAVMLAAWTVSYFRAFGFQWNGRLDDDGRHRRWAVRFDTGAVFLLFARTGEATKYDLPGMQLHHWRAAGGVGDGLMRMESYSLGPHQVSVFPAWLAAGPFSVPPLAWLLIHRRRVPAGFPVEPPAQQKRGEGVTRGA